METIDTNPLPNGYGKGVQKVQWFDLSTPYEIEQHNLILCNQIYVKRKL